MTLTMAMELDGERTQGTGVHLHEVDGEPVEAREPR